MLSYVRRIFEIVFPLSDDERLLEDVTETSFCAKLNPTTLQNDITALTSFRDKEVRAAIHLLKFHHHEHAMRLLCALFF